MSKLPKYTVTKRDDNKWALTKDGASRATKVAEKKSDLTAGGVLQKAVGKAGASVKIQKEDGKFQEERTFPRDRDPKSSPG